MLVDGLGLAEDNLTVILNCVGGGVGGKPFPLVKMDAAALSPGVGAPVKVQRLRAQEMTNACRRVPTSHRVRVRLEGEYVTDCSHRFASAHVIYSNAVLPLWMQTFTDFMGEDGAAHFYSPIGYDRYGAG